MVVSFVIILTPKTQRKLLSGILIHGNKMMNLRNIFSVSHSGDSGIGGGDKSWQVVKPYY